LAIFFIEQDYFQNLMTGAPVTPENVPADRRRSDRTVRKSSKNQTVVKPTKFGATVLLLWGHSVNATIFTTWTNT